MGDSRRGERKLQADMPRRLREESEDQLADDEIKLIVEKSTQVWKLFSFTGPNDERKIDAMCDMLRPYLTQIWHGGPKCTCSRGQHMIDRKVYTGDKHAA